MSIFRTGRPGEVPWSEIDAARLEQELGAPEPPLVVDVRTRPEVAAYHIPKILWIPLDELAARRGEIDANRRVVLVCEHGIRSSHACGLLWQAGFTRLANLTGGMSAWTGPTERGIP